MSGWIFAYRPKFSTSGFKGGASASPLTAADLWFIYATNTFFARFDGVFLSILLLEKGKHKLKKNLNVNSQDLVIF